MLFNNIGINSQIYSPIQNVPSTPQLQPWISNHFQIEDLQTAVVPDTGIEDSLVSQESRADLVPSTPVPAIPEISRGFQSNFIHPSPYPQLSPYEPAVRRNGSSSRPKSQLKDLNVHVDQQVVPSSPFSFSQHLINDKLNVSLKNSLPTTPSKREHRVLSPSKQILNSRTIELFKGEEIFI